MLGIGGYLWRLGPGNPILLRVVAAGGRRGRDLAIRCAYLGALVLLVLMLLLSRLGDRSAGLAELSKQSAELFYWMSYAQLVLVALLAPVFTAGAITQEKDSQTYDILLATPLSNGQIVLGSLLSRLFFVVALLVSGIPIFAITQIFGGVGIRDIVLSFLIASATGLITGALAMAVAVLKVGTRRTIFSFYMLILLYLAVPLVLEGMGYLQYRWRFSGTGQLVSHISWLAGVHPFLALRAIFGETAYAPPEPGMVNHLGWWRAWYLSSPHTFYVALMSAASVVLVLPSIVLLRRLAQSSRTVRQWAMEKLKLSSGDRARRPRRVWSNPIAWREAKTKASANRAVLLRYGFMSVGLAGAVVLLAMSGQLGPAVTRTFLLSGMAVEVAVILLVLTQSAASTVTREKEDGTIDLLLSTPITSRYYTWGKLRGLVSFVLPLLAVPLGSVLLFVGHHVLVRAPLWRSGTAEWIVAPEALAILPATLVMVCAFAAIVGMQMSLLCRRTVMAVMSSVGIVGSALGMLALVGQGAASSMNPPQFGLVIGAFSPFTLMGLLVDPATTTAGNLPGGATADSRLLVLFAGWVAVMVYGLVVWSVYKAMVRNFDMTVRRQG